jgi:pimeloyl-ACP methyl ester carboxylesterase
MNPSLPAVVMVFAAPAANLPTELWQVAPDAKGKAGWLGTPRTKDRAVLLIPGLKIHPFRPALATRPERHPFQEPGSELVRALAKDSDVFAFGYAQTAPLDAVVHAPGLRNSVANLKRAGYKEIVLVGHSAGGVIARLFATAYPDAGVTKVITVGSPHAGAEAAHIPVGYPKAQAPFVQSLAPEVRTAARVAADMKSEQTIQMACVVCKLGRFDGDGLVNVASQWPEDCRKCGTPAVLVSASHWDAMLNPTSAKTIAELARDPLARWSADEVEKARKVLFGDAARPVPRKRSGYLRQKSGVAPALMVQNNMVR